MNLKSDLKKTGVALLKAVPVLGYGAAALDVIETLIRGTENPRWKTIQAATAFAGTSSFMTGVFFGGFHHPAAAAVALTGGVGLHLMAGAAEFAPARIQAPFTRAVGRAVDAFLGVCEVASR